MKSSLLSLICCFLLLFNQANAQCGPGQVQIKVVLMTDQLPTEISWTVKDNANNVVMQSQTGMTSTTLYQDSICVPAGSCYQFRINDLGANGICCGYGQGHVEVYYNGSLVKRDSTFGNQSSAWMGCSSGQNCNNALVLTQQGFQTAPGPNTWYEFTPPTTGMYNVSTCNMNNVCNTKLWMYDYCNNLQYSNSNAATIYYADDNCGLDGFINAYLLSTHTYYIRVGDANNSCANSSINWEINYNGSVAGCLDTVACNFNPFATISDPNSCMYYPNANCPTGSDLVLDSARLSTTIQMDTQPSNSLCTIREGCMNGYGTRELVRFDTRISNIGATDFYAGAPPANQNAYSPIFEWDQCHGHWHFEDYAEYLLADAQNNFIPIGYKNGFCVIDLSCSTGSPKFGCNNMGITAGCADIYSSGLDCQWIDITDVPDGNYKLILRANWVPRPDFYGRYETSYFNNWARACITLGHGTGGARTVTVQPNCAPYVDCNGVQNGLSVKDCDGNCNGTRLTGDLNQDGLRNNSDVSTYLYGSIYHTIAASKCHDLNDDGKINVVDAALLYDCSKHGPGTIPAGHSHEPCRFPDKIKNPTQSADFSIGHIDYLAKTVDIYVKNETGKLLGYQLKVKGMKLFAAQNTIPGFSANVQFRPTGQIVVLTNNEIPIPNNTSTVMCLRLQYTTIDSNKVCIDSLVAVNEAYEEIIANKVDSVCITTQVTNGVTDIDLHQKVSLSPNPFHKSTNLFVQTRAGEVFSVEIFDVYGRLVRTYPRQSTSYLEIERGSLQSGIYFLKLTGPDWQTKEKLMIE